MLRAIGAVIAAIFDILIPTQDIPVEAKPSESITIDSLSPQGKSTLAEERTHVEMMWGILPQG